jgi:hypothetical protein
VTTGDDRGDRAGDAAIPAKNPPVTSVTCDLLCRGEKEIGKERSPIGLTGSPCDTGDAVTTDDADAPFDDWVKSKGIGRGK